MSIGRREFIMLFGGAAAWPVAGARAQQTARVRQVVIMATALDDPATQQWLLRFQRRLAELGWLENRNIRFEGRSTGGIPERIRANTLEVVGLRPDVIFSEGTALTTALHARTDSLPVVFVQVPDPVGIGLVKTLARPGGNVTGFTNAMSSLGGKRLGLLREVSPVSRVGFLFNRATAPGGGSFYMEDLRSAAASLDVTVTPLEIRDEGEIEAVIAGFAGMGGAGIVTDTDSFIAKNRDRIITTVSRYRLAAIYSQAEQAAAGGLLAYGADTRQQWEAAAGYVDRILRGEKATNLPVQQPTKFVLTINLKAAKALGLTVPPTLLALADEVIE